MKCSYVENYINLYLDGELETETVEELLNHIKECGECRKKYIELSKLHNSLENLFTEKELPKGFEEELLNKIYEKPVEKNKVWNIPMIRNSFIATISIMLIFCAFFIGINKFQNNKGLRAGVVANGPKIECETYELANLHQEFNSIEDSKKAILAALNIKFPTYIPKGYTVNKVIYDINKGKCTVTINYINTSSNLLTIVYNNLTLNNDETAKKGNDNKLSGAAQSDGGLISSSNSSSKLEKEIKYKTADYDLTISLHYNSEPKASEVVNNDELSEIAKSIVKQRGW